jgi:hypothetical protein
VSGKGSGDLSPRVAAELQQLAPRIREGLKRTATDLVAVGKDLLQAKGLLPHGDWMPWLAMEFDLSVSTAENFMRVARLAEQLGGQFADVANLPAAALYELASASTPPEVVAQVAEGEVPPTLQAIREAKTGARALKEIDPGRLGGRLAQAILAADDLSAEELAEALAGRVNPEEIRSIAEVLTEAADLLDRWFPEEQEPSGEPSLADLAPIVGMVVGAIRDRRAARRAER